MNGCSKLRPGWAAGHRHASGSFAVAGDVDRAIQHAARASEIDPSSAEFAVHAGSLLAKVGLHRDAIDYFARAVEIEPDDPDLLRHLSGAAFAHWATGKPRSTWHCAPMRWTPAERAARITRPSCCCAATGSTRRRNSSSTLAVDEDDAIGYRLLSAAEMLRGRPERALDAIDRALAFAPDAAEYHLHRGNLLYRLARFDEAADAFDRAAALDPENPAARRSQLTVYFDSGRFREAVAVGGELIRTAPDNEEYAQAVLAGAEPPLRNPRRRVHRPRRAAGRPPPDARPQARLLVRVANPMAGHPRPDHPRDPHPVRRLDASATAGHCSSRSCTY